MIRITNNEGLTLELDSKTVITIERNNQLFNDADNILRLRMKPWAKW